MTIKKPSLFFRALILGAQGVFYNAFCEFLRLTSVNLPHHCYSPVLPCLSPNLPPFRRVPRRRGCTYLVSNLFPSVRLVSNVL